MILNVTKQDETWLKFQCDEEGVYEELADYFKFRPEKYVFDPRFKARKWDGYIRLFNKTQRLLRVGHYDEVEQFCKDRDYELVYHESEYTRPKHVDNVSRTDIEAFAASLKLQSKGKPIEAAYYQIDAVYECLRRNRMICLSPTASGKSLIIYILILYLLREKKKILLVTITEQLVRQMRGDFEDYSSANNFPVEQFFRMIFSGQKRDFTIPAQISTWQSLQHFDDEFFSDYDAIICDEAHSAKAKQLQRINDCSINAKYRIGLTGSMDGLKDRKSVV